MKHLIRFAFLSLSLFSQAQENQENHKQLLNDLNALRVNIIIEKLQLSPEKQSVFRPLLSNYTEQIRQVRRHLFSVKVNPHEANDEQASKMIQAHFEEARQTLQIREAFYQKALAVLSPKQMLKVFGIDRKLDEEIRKRMQKRMGKKFDSLDQNNSKLDEYKIP